MDLQLSEVKVDVNCCRGLEQLMMGLPRAPKSRPARPAVRLQPPKLKVKIKDIIQPKDEFEILQSSSISWTESGPALINQANHQSSLCQNCFKLILQFVLAVRMVFSKTLIRIFDLSNCYVIHLSSDFVNSHLAGGEVQ